MPHCPKCKEKLSFPFIKCPAEKCNYRLVNTNNPFAILSLRQQYLKLESRINQNIEGISSSKKESSAVKSKNYARNAAKLTIGAALLYFVMSTFWFAMTGEFRFVDAATIGAGTILPAIILIIPQYVNQQINTIHERISKDLENSAKVYGEAFKLLEWVGSDTDTYFAYTSATPYFGLYKSHVSDKDHVKHNEWRNLLEARIKQSNLQPNITTEIYSLKWEPFTTGRSALFELCKVLAKKNHEVDRQQAIGIYKTALTHWSDFISSIMTKYRNSDTHVFISSAKHEVFAFVARKKNETRCVFAVIAEDESSFKMFGAYSQYDMLLVKTTTKILSIRKRASQCLTNTLFNDTRSPFQIARDEELLAHFSELSDNPSTHSTDTVTPDQTYSFFNKEIPDFIYKVNKNVFPFQISKGYRLWAKALEKIRKDTNGDTVGIDIGTGCGILAIHLSTMCKVYATEKDPKAMANAIYNYNRFKIHSIDNKLSIHDVLFYCCDPENTFKIINNALPISEDRQYIITFHYKFYDSYFCPMTHDFDYNLVENSNKLTNRDNHTYSSQPGCGTKGCACQISTEEDIRTTIQAINNNLTGRIRIIMPHHAGLITDFNLMSILNHNNFSKIETETDPEYKKTTLYIASNR